MANEKRLVWLDQALLIATDACFPGSLPEHDNVLLATVRKKLSSLPTVDAVEVVHGRWLSLNEYALKIGADSTGYEGGWVFCSECEQPMRELYGWGYCPNCGAKMDGERKNNG